MAAAAAAASARAAAKRGRGGGGAIRHTVWKWFDDPRVPGVALHRVACWNDPVEEGLRAREVLLGGRGGRPEHERGLLFVDLGGGRCRDEYHLWSARDDTTGKPRRLTVEEADEIYRLGERRNSWSQLGGWMSAFLMALDLPVAAAFLNVELAPDRWLPDLPDGYDLKQMARQRGWRVDWRRHGTPEGVQRVTDRLRVWACAEHVRMLKFLLDGVHAEVRSNIGGLAFKRGHAGHRYAGGNLHGNTAVELPAPFLYLADGRTMNEATAATAELARIVKTPMVRVLASPCWAGDPWQKVRPRDQIRYEKFTFPGDQEGGGHDWPVKVLGTHDTGGWGARWKLFENGTRKDAAGGATVLWFNDGNSGPRPTDAACELMREVLG